MAQADAGHTTHEPHTEPPIDKLRRIRREAEEAIERLLVLVDALSGDPDLEDADADDPTRFEGQNCASNAANMNLGHDDAEEDDPGEDNGDNEPSLGSVGFASERAYQPNWAAGGSHDREADDGENGIADVDGLAEQTTGEPSLGSFDRMLNQEKSWRQHEGPSCAWVVTDAEQDDADNEDSDPAEECEPSGIADLDGYAEQRGTNINGAVFV